MKLFKWSQKNIILITNGEKIMKKIGLIGWTAPESTIMYYKKLTHELN